MSSKYLDIEVTELSIILFQLGYLGERKSQGLSVHCLHWRDILNGILCTIGLNADHDHAELNR